MARKNLTQAAVERLTPPKAGRLEVFDKLLPAFGLRVSETGHKSWFLFYRAGGKQRRHTLGTLATIPSLADARELARRVLRDVQAGKDPAAPKVAEPPARVDSVASVASQFVEKYAKPINRSWREIEKLLQRHVVSRWGPRDIRTITRRDVRELLNELVDRGHPIAANRALAAMRKLCNWAIGEDILPVNPCDGLRAPGKEIARDRVLTDDELAELWRAADTIGGVAGGFFQLLILTAQRRDEVASMRWDDLDIGKRVWTLPRANTKNDKSHVVPLSELAIEILTNLPHFGQFVFTTTGDKPIAGFSKLKDRIDSVAGFADWRIHDLRRTAATGMAKLDTIVSVIAKVLNHSERGVTAIYDRHTYDREKREALERWARHVQALVQPSPSNVVELRA